MDDRQIAQILHAKANELETYVKPRLGNPGTTDLDWLIADVALIAGLVAEYIGKVEVDEEQT